MYSMATIVVDRPPSTDVELWDRTERPSQPAWSGVGADRGRGEPTPGGMGLAPVSAGQYAHLAAAAISVTE
jgi:hypothetical protein